MVPGGRAGLGLPSAAWRPLMASVSGPGEAAALVSSLLHQASFLLLSLRHCPPLAPDQAARRLVAAVVDRPLR
eukprot:8427161-Alexandrium_andersonii.AAC.1